MTRSQAVAAGKYALGLALLSYVIFDNRVKLAEALTQPWNLGAWVLTAVFVALSATTTFVRWYVLVRAQELPFTLRDALRIGMIAYFFNAVLPSAIGGDLVKAVALARKQSRRTVAVATVLADRIVGLWAIIWLVSGLGAFYSLVNPELLRSHEWLAGIVRTTWIVLGASVAAWIVVGFLPAERAVRFASRLERLPRIGGSVAEAWRAVWMYRNKPQAIAMALGLSFVSQMLYVLCFHHAAQVFAGSAAAQVPSLSEHSLIVPLGMIVQAIFPAPGGIGGGEFAFGKMYAQLRGHEYEYLGVFGMMALRVTTWAVGFAGYLVGTQTRPSPPPAGETIDVSTEPA